METKRVSRVDARLDKLVWSDPERELHRLYWITCSGVPPHSSEDIMIGIGIQCQLVLVSGDSCWVNLSSYPAGESSSKAIRKSNRVTEKNLRDKEKDAVSM